MSDDSDLLVRTGPESKVLENGSANEEEFWNSDPPFIPPVLWLPAMHARWAIEASQKAPMFGLQLYHLALASQHCVHHLAKEISDGDKGSNLDTLFSQVNVLVGLINDLGDCIDSANSHTVAYGRSEAQGKLERIFEGLSTLKIIGASDVEESRAAFQNMKHTDWIDIQEYIESPHKKRTLTRRCGGFGGPYTTYLNCLVRKYRLEPPLYTTTHVEKDGRVQYGASLTLYRQSEKLSWSCDNVYPNSRIAKQAVAEQAYNYLTDEELKTRPTSF
ncbi:hypothetical protein PIIN_09008 [Serendipita indica DSM 11827]|uniref:Uncharacterized protein n=1 Tax=Serendipita indica (strain DSM 11827) TaxID=1109443 RepID=G4TUN0_SERID|nr:hypothetical protein PIIN_09008 [Serendipita indica DSM 11827]